VGVLYSHRMERRTNFYFQNNFIYTSHFSSLVFCVHGDHCRLHHWHWASSLLSMSTIIAVVHHHCYYRDHNCHFQLPLPTITIIINCNTNDYCHPLIIATTIIDHCWCCTIAIDANTTAIVTNEPLPPLMSVRTRSLLMWWRIDGANLVGFKIFI